MDQSSQHAEDDFHQVKIGRRRIVLAALGLFAFVVAVYLPSVRYGYIYDESVILFRTTPPRTLGELVEKSWAPHFPGLEYFRPVPHATYLVQYMWHRNEPGYFHLFNAILMGITATIVLALFRLPCFRIRFLPALVAAALFAVHPASSSCVTPIVGRETLMGACLAISAVYAFFRGGRLWYFAALCLLALALLSKEQSIVIPLLFVLGDVLGLPADAPGRNIGRWLGRYLPVAGVVAIYLSIRWSFFSGGEYELQIVDHPFGPLSSVAYMVQTIFLPFRELAYEPALGVWLSFDRLAAATVILMLLIALVIRRRRELRNVALFWCGWALVTIAPTANIIQQQAPYSERYIFLATLAVLAVAAAVVSSLPASARMRTGTILIGFAIVAVAAAVTIERGRCFENTLTFSRQWAKTSPDFGEAQMALGIELYQRGRIDEAVECFNQGIGTQPEARNFCRMWLGKMRLVQGRYAEAEALFQRLIEQEPRAPYTYYLSGVADRGLNEPDAAVARFQRAMEISPQSAGALFLLAKTLQEQGQASASQDDLARAASLTDVDLGFSDIRDADVQTLSGLSDLRYILLESTSITDEALRHLQGMRSLHRLWIPGTRITDAGLAYLADLPELNSLVLMNTQITDEGVAFLVKMKSLGHLDVRYTKLSREGLSRLKHELPECLILYEEPQ